MKTMKIRQAAARHCLISILVFTGLVLTGCGSDSKDSPPTPDSPPPAPAVMIAPTELQVQGDAAFSSQPTASISIGITNPPADGLYVGYGYTVNGIDAMSLQPTSSTSGALHLSFRNPAVIGPGVYSDYVVVRVCLDDQCANQVSGSPRTVNVQYTVTGVQAPQPSFSLSSSSLIVDSQWFAQLAPTNSQITYTISNPGSQYFSVDTTSTTNGIQSVYDTTSSGGGYSGANGTINISFKHPSQLAQGTYNDVITVTASCGYNCLRGIANHVQQIAVEYRLGNTTSGPNAATIRAVPIVANDLIWNASQSRIYLAAPSSDSTHSNTVAVLNPSDGLVESSSFVGSEPSAMAISDDDQYLYVALDGSNAVRRKLLPSLSQDILIPLGAASDGGTLTAADIQVAPAQPQTIAVARKRSGNNGSAVNVAIYDGPILRPNLSTSSYPFGAHWLQWGNATQLHASTWTSPGYIYSLDVDENGVAVSSTTTTSGASTGRIQIAGGVLYTSAGEAFDPLTRARLGIFSPPQSNYPRNVVADPQLNKLFMLTDSGSTMRLHSFNLTTFAPIASVEMSRFGYGHNGGRLIRWGTDGLAFANVDTHIYNSPPQGRVLLITGPFVNNPTN